MEPYSRCSESNDQTEGWACKIADCLQSGDVLAFFGDLGAGKTTFVRGLAKGLHSTDLVSSPTFVIMHIYEGRLPIYHFDAYRLNGPQELLDIGADEYFEAKGVTCIEWSERAQGILPSERVDIIMRRSGDYNFPERRIIEFVGRGPRGEQLQTAIAEVLG